MNEKTCCFTGHRPDFFPWKDNHRDPRFHILMERIENAVDTVLSKGVKKFICGNALGVDTWAAQIVLEKKQEDPEIKLEIALPFSWHNSNVQSCRRVQEQADLVHVVSKADSKIAAYFDRNKYMVDHSDYIIAVYDNERSPKSGTKKTIDMAKKKGIEIIQIAWGDIHM